MPIEGTEVDIQSEGTNTQAEKSLWSNIKGELAQPDSSLDVWNWENEKLG